MRIKKTVDNLVLTHQTKDPYKISKQLGITIIEENLGSINGYYNEILGIKFIHINENLSDSRKQFTVAHELGHAILHPNFNQHFLKKHTLFNIDRYEKEANKFAIHLISDERTKNLKTVEEFISFFDWSDNDGFSECSQAW